MQVFNAKIVKTFDSLEGMQEDFEIKVREILKDGRISKYKLSEIGQPYWFSLQVCGDDPHIIYKWINTFLTEAGNTYILTDLS